jgi:hypothetical protein
MESKMIAAREKRPVRSPLGATRLIELAGALWLLLLWALAAATAVIAAGLALGTRPAQAGWLYWDGYRVTACNPCTSASMTIIMPAVQFAPVNGGSSQFNDLWVGISDTGDTTVAQVWFPNNVASGCPNWSGCITTPNWTVISGGLNTSHSSQSDGTFDAYPGDVIKMSLNCTTPCGATNQQWNFSVTDYTQKWTWSSSAPASANVGLGQVNYVPNEDNGTGSGGPTANYDQFLIYDVTANGAPVNLQTQGSPTTSSTAYGGTNVQNPPGMTSFWSCWSPAGAALTSPCPKRVVTRAPAGFRRR